MQKTDSQLNTQALQIKQETLTNANTANRVGTLFQDIVDSKINKNIGATPYSVAVFDVTGNLFYSFELYDNLGAYSINTNTRELTDTLGNMAVDWDNRLLKKSDGTTALDWENHVNIQTLAELLDNGNTSGPNNIFFDAGQGIKFANSSRVREGNTDAGLGGAKGVALVCSLDYELKWEAGRQYVMDQTGTFIRQSLYNFTNAPTVADDVTKGYMDGSLWTLDDGTVYECIDASTGTWAQKIAAGVYITDANTNVFYSGVEATTTLNGDCKRNTFHQLAENNILVLDNTDNTFHQSAQNNTLGDTSNNNVFEIGASSNTLADGCSNNTFKQGAVNNILDSNCIGNTFEQYVSGFTFGAGLQNVTIEKGTIGQNYTSIDYSFMYGQNYPAKIFTDGGTNFYSYYDPANNRIVLHNLSTPLAAPTYIGGGAGSGDMLKSTYDINNNGIVDKAQAMVTQGRNSTGVTLYKGTIVYIDGATGQLPNFVKAQANTEATSAGTFGVVIADIANNSDGWVCTIGLLDNIDTRTIATNPFTDVTLAVGDNVYLNPTIAGYITNVKPSAPNHVVYIGKVVNVGPATQGAIVYRMQNGYELDELHDVSAQTPADNNTLIYNSTNGLWEAKALKVGDNTNGTAVTGNTNNTLSKSLFIPANTLKAGSFAQLTARVAKTGNAGTLQLRLYWNTSPSLVGAILLGTTAAGAANSVFSQMSRLIPVEVANGTLNGTRMFTPSTFAVNDFGVSTAAISTLALNWTVDSYLICAIQNGSSLDSSVCNFLTLI